MQFPQLAGASPAPSGPLPEASMDDLNYRRLMKYQKRRCEESGATQYMDPQGIYRSIIEDHERFETCFDCGYLVGWCPTRETCEQPTWVAERTKGKKKKAPKKKPAAQNPTAKKTASKKTVAKKTVASKNVTKPATAAKRVTKKK